MLPWRTQKVNIVVSLEEYEMFLEFLGNVINTTVKKKFRKDIKNDHKDYHVNIVKIYGRDVGLIRAFVTFYNRVYSLNII